MGNLFDPNNPKTWPQNYKAPITAAFTNKGVSARDLAKSRAKDRFSGLTPKANDPYYESGKTLFNMGVVEPIKSMGRTVTGKNAAVYANPLNGASWKQRLGAFGEDALNVASVYPGVRAGATALKETRPALRLAADNVLFPEPYEYGIHTSKTPGISGFIDSTARLNKGGAMDALPGHSYQWRLSPDTGSFTNAEMADRAADMSWKWSERLSNRYMMEDDEIANITEYLTRGPANKAIPDENLALEKGSYLENPSSAVNAPLEILDKVPYNPAYGNNKEAYNEAIKKMLASRQREIGYNNKRLMYQRGLMP
jgi:hypothetical protein